ncbi:MAG: AAA family ATPase [Caldilineaceae bacterium]|nr:AAA family ATPase [Caldilineaceae bacterium]MCB0139857.1 AAA family ATPase [Caldilineaceae bacterium]
MSNYRLLRHKNFDYSASRLPTTIRQKALWAQVLLGTRGRTPSVKSTAGTNARWRRTPVQGNHYYMWWIPQSESRLRTAGNGETQMQQTILVHSIRHHDQTDEPIELGDLNDYDEVAVGDLDPRFEEQRRVSFQLDEPDVALATIKGLPGSGKTISLLYLVKDILKRAGQGDVLYVTYTSRLKRAAEEFLKAQVPILAQRVRFRTLNEIESELTGTAVFSEPFGVLGDFARFLESQSNSVVGPWRKYPQTLYTEVRAHLLGRSFPAGYPLPTIGMDEQRFGLDALSAEAYAAYRHVDADAAEAAHRMAVRVAAGRFFVDQIAARTGLEQLMRNQQPRWLHELSALIVDEVQDLTLLQIALLGEMARQRAEQIARAAVPDAPFIFTVAGDESQIVQPSGFDWGVTKNVLGEQLGTWPTEFEFRHQRRAPRVLAHLIDQSWNFYRHLPKSHRPSAQRQSFLDEASKAAHRYEDGGAVLLCPLGDVPVGSKNRGDGAWTALLDELTDKPGRVIIDVTETLATTLSPSLRQISEEVLFLPRDIKGLERTTVIVYGLNETYLRAVQLCEDAVGMTDNIPRFEARRLFDELRVALSRSTQNLVLLEPATAPVLAEIGITPHHNFTPQELSTVAWDDLIELLRTEEMSEIEAIEGYLDEVEDLVERGRWDQAYRRNRRAHDLAVQVNDAALQRETQSQYIEAHMQEAESLFNAQQWAAAYMRNQDAKTLALQFGDPLLLDRVENQRNEITQRITEQAEQLFEQAQQWAHGRSYQMGLRDIQAASELAGAVQDKELQTRIADIQAEICHDWAYQLTSVGATPANMSRAAALLHEAAAVSAAHLNPTFAQAMDLLSQRYREVAQNGQLARGQIETVLGLADAYVALMAPLTDRGEAYTFIVRWLDETFVDIGDLAPLFYRWALAAQRLDEASLYPDLDERIWDLENRIEHIVARANFSRREQTEVARFQAFLLGYNDEAEAASAAWEALGDLPEAAHQARRAGQLERAYDLLRSAKESSPEELTIAVRALRLLRELEHKHSGLTPLEKATFSRQLAALQELLQPPETGADPFELGQDGFTP